MDTICYRDITLNRSRLTDKEVNILNDWKYLDTFGIKDVNDKLFKALAVGMGLKSFKLSINPQNQNLIDPISDWFHYSEIPAKLGTIQMDTDVEELNIQPGDIVLSMTFQDNFTIKAKLDENPGFVFTWNPIISQCEYQVPNIGFECHLDHMALFMNMRDTFTYIYNTTHSPWVFDPNKGQKIKNTGSKNQIFDVQEKDGYFQYTIPNYAIQNCQIRSKGDLSDTEYAKGDYFMHAPTLSYTETLQFPNLLHWNFMPDVLWLCYQYGSENYYFNAHQQQWQEISELYGFELEYVDNNLTFSAQGYPIYTINIPSSLEPYIVHVPTIRDELDISYSDPVVCSDIDTTITTEGMPRGVGNATGTLVVKSSIAYDLTKAEARKVSNLKGNLETIFNNSPITEDYTTNSIKLWIKEGNTVTKKKEIDSCPLAAFAITQATSPKLKTGVNYNVKVQQNFSCKEFKFFPLPPNFGDVEREDHKIRTDSFYYESKTHINSYNMMTITQNTMEEMKGNETINLTNDLTPAFYVKIRQNSMANFSINNSTITLDVSQRNQTFGVDRKEMKYVTTQVKVGSIFQSSNAGQEHKHNDFYAIGFMPK